MSDLTKHLANLQASKDIDWNEYLYTCYITWIRWDYQKPDPISWIMYIQPSGDIGFAFNDDYGKLLFSSDVSFTLYWSPMPKAPNIYKFIESNTELPNIIRQYYTKKK